MINNIVFDMGGVLAKIHPERAIRSFEAIGVSDAADRINPYNHSGLFGDLERGTIRTSLSANSPPIVATTSTPQMSAAHGSA